MQIRFDPWVEKAAVMEIAEDARQKFGVAVELVEVRDTASNPIPADARSNPQTMRNAHESRAFIREEIATYFRVPADML